MLVESNTDPLALHRIYNGNNKIVTPNENVLDAYDWIKSSDRDAKMGALSYENRRCLILMPGNYNWTGQALVLDTNYVDLYGLGSPESIVLRRTDTSTGTHIIGVEQKAFDVRIDNILFQSAVYDDGQKGHGLQLTVGNEKTSATTTHGGSYCRVQATGIGANVDWSRYEKDYEVYVSVPGGDSGWYEPYYMNETYNNDDSLMIVGNPGESTGDVTCRVTCKASIYKNLRGYSDPEHNVVGSNKSTCSIWGKYSIVGRWYDCIASDNAWRIGQYQELRAYMENCEADSYSFGGDAEGTGDGEISGIFVNCVGGDDSFGGCVNFGLPCSGIFINCRAGSSSYGMGVVCSGQFFNCTGGDKCFGGYNVLSYKPTFSGYAINCIAGINSFGQGHADAQLSGICINCRMGTLAESLAGTCKSNVTNFSGKCTNCHPAKPSACTSNTTVYPFDSGHTYNNTGATGAVTFSLPDAKVGLRFTFIRIETGAGKDLYADPQASDHILKMDGTDLGAGKYYGNEADAFGLVTIECRIGGYWQVEEQLGTWLGET